MPEKIQYLIFRVDKEKTINDACLDAVESQVNGKSGEHLYLYIQTYGGNPFSVVAIMNILQSRFKKISAVIPKYAKSAGTLMALGADIIYMSVRSALGPLDLPMKHPKDGSRISALDFKNSITEASTVVDILALEKYRILRDVDGRNDIGLSKPDAAKISFEYATNLVKPITEKVDPYHLTKSIRELRIARDYATDLLYSRMMQKNWQKAFKVATRFVSIYPVHEYSIFAKEARDILLLTIGDLDNLPDWRLIKGDINSICSGKNYVILYGEKVKTPAVIPQNVQQPAESKKE